MSETETNWSAEAMAAAYFDRDKGALEKSLPFQSRTEEWESWQRFLDMVCMTALILKEQKPEEAPRRIGSLLADQELMNALEPSEEVEFKGREVFGNVFFALIEREKNSAGAGLPFASFLTEGLLSPMEALAFLMAVAVDLNRKYERVFGVLKEDVQPSAKPTLGLVLDLGRLIFSPEEDDGAVLWDEDSFFRKYLLEEVHQTPDQSRLTATFSLNRRAVQILAGQPMQMGSLSRCGEIFSGEEEMEEVLVHEDALEELIQVFSTVTAGGETGVIQLCGMEGCGRKFLMRALASISELDVLCVDVRRLLAEDEARIGQLCREMVIKCVCEKALLYLDGLSFTQENLWKTQKLLTILQDSIRMIFVGSDSDPAGALSVRGSWHVIPVSLPDSLEQKKFWQYFAEKYQVVLDPKLELDQLVSRYDMPPGRIEQVLLCSRLNAEIGEGGYLVPESLLETQIRLKCAASLGQYATRLKSPFTWDDLQLAENSKKLLNDACNRVRLRSVVQNQYGFAKKLPYGSGTSVVLYGPPGTGKTMAAQVLAKELGLDIYRVDLSQIGSKYIGETEKNLGKVFDAARFSNAILFFDEADALFTKRTDVSNSNDKYANAETAYLLQKIEEYPGLSVLATNVMQNFDPAFKRRMTFMIPVEQPDEAVRLKLWQKVFPENTPLAPDLNFEIFAKTAELTGSNIKSAALMAAYRAAAENRPVSNQDLIEAIDFEYRRTGRVGISNELYGAVYLGGQMG